MERVLFTKRAYISLCVELRRFKAAETGGVFIGYFENGVWYIIENIFSGPFAIHKSAEYSYDYEYVKYQAEYISGLYDKEMFVIGLWHSHITSSPFSIEDENTNLQFAQQNAFGALTCLIDISAKKCLMYGISPKGKYTQMPYYVLNDNVVNYSQMEIFDE